MANGIANNIPPRQSTPDPGPESERMDALQSWLFTQLSTQLGFRLGTALSGGPAFTLAPASNDASFRRYFRISFADGAAPLIVMDAPPDKEDCRPFVHVTGLFAAAGAHVPKLLAQDLDQGFLLLSDLGHTTYLSALNAAPDTTTADRLYRDAIAALVAIQRASRPGVLPEYDRELLERELMLFPDWYVARQLGSTLSSEQNAGMRSGFDALLANNLAQPRVFVHRDYHSRNLMVSTPNPGILDFQDAVYGPITYDLVSLLRDAYIDWEEAQVLEWCVGYWEAARAAQLPVQPDFGEFYRDFEWMGAQRQLKVLGIFARRAHRDGKEGYLKDQPLVMSYLRRTCGRYRELKPILHLLDALHSVEKQSGHTF
jgi:aminoglycoside/choline kinase family phosphotransferase